MTCDYTSAKWNYVRVTMYVLLHVGLHVTLTDSLFTGGQILPLFAHVEVPYDHSVHSQPRLLTSGAASILQPVIHLVDNLLLGNRLKPLVPGTDPNVPPALPHTFVSVRQPEPVAAATTQAPAGDHGHGDKDWSYDDTNEVQVGPKFWSKSFAKCAAKLQSPIDIAGRTIRYRPIPLMSMRLANGQTTTPVIIKNDGSSVSVKPTTSNIILEGGALPGQFVLTNIHFHWSKSDLVGSEHKLGGKSYPLEMHLVTFNRKYRNMQEASGANDGIHVIGVLYEVSKKRNQGLSFCTSKLDSVTEFGAEVDGGSVDVSGLLPTGAASMFRYRGSLTTPPCTGNVLWTVYANPQLISIEQLRKFRNLKLGKKVQPLLGANIRPLQPMDNRVIFTNNPTYTYY